MEELPRPPVVVWLKGEEGRKRVKRRRACRKSSCEKMRICRRVSEGRKGRGGLS